MNAGRILYRIRQFKRFLIETPPAAADIGLAQRMLSDRQLALFWKLQPVEQAHSLAVYKELVSTGESSPELLTAALLHDIGKSRYLLKAWERVLIVLAKAVIPDRVHRWGGGPARGWRRPFVVAEQHPAWGAEMATAAGTQGLVVELIRRHQEPLTHKNGRDQGKSGEDIPLTEILLRKLQAVDDDN